MFMGRESSEQAEQRIYCKLNKLLHLITFVFCLKPVLASPVLLLAFAFESATQNIHIYSKYDTNEFIHIISQILSSFSVISNYYFILSLISF